MNPPGGSATPAGGICTTCPHGKIEVIVWKHAICWDTPTVGWPSAKDPTFEGVTVRLNEVVDRTTIQPNGTKVVQYHALAEQVTPADGKVTFANLLPFESYKLTASRYPDYDEVTPELSNAQQSGSQGNPPAAGQPSVESGSQVQLRNEVAVEVGKTSYADLVLREKPARLNPDGSWTQGRECTRRHGPPASPPPSARTLGSLFWDDEPALLVFRDILWAIVLPLGIVLCALIGILAKSMLLLSIAALIAALWAYIGAIIFGVGFGVPACIVAAALFAVLLIVNLLLAAFHSTTPPDPAGLGILAGVWAAFALGYGGGRRDEWRSDRFFWPFPTAPFWPLVLVAIVAALLIGLLVGAVSNQLSIGLVIVTFLGGSIFGGLAGWAGFGFANEGETNGPFVAADFHLPYDGERYCLQGPRGFWSHYEVEDGGNDFSLPAGTAALCAKEGHIVSFYDLSRAEPPVNSYTHPPQQCFDKLQRGRNNHIEVRHKDASTAKYVYLKTDGITGLSWSRPVKDAVPEGSPAWLSPTSEATRNPLHVRPGHQLGNSGWPAFVDLPADTPGGPRWDVFLIGLAFAALCLGFFFIMSFTVYEGPPPNQVDIFHADHCYTYATSHNSADQFTDGCYCENLTGHNVEQTSNTYSDLLFPILGLILLFLFAMKGPNFQPYKNRTTDRVVFSLLFGLVLIFMGPGSMFFHGWFRLPLSILDGASMYFFAGFLFAYNLVRIFDGGESLCWMLYIGSVLLALIVLVSIVAVDPAADTSYIMYVFVGIALIIQAIVVLTCSIHTDGLGKMWFWIGAGLIIIATVFQVASRTGGPLCTSSGLFSPTSLVQGHAIWHMLSAMGIFLIYFYFQRELPVSSCTDFPRLHFAVVDKPPAGNPLDEDPRQSAAGQTQPQAGYKPVKFVDPGVTEYEARPRSMRKHLSSNGSIGMPPLPPDFAEFRPEGGGQHPVPINGASGSGGSAGSGSSPSPGGGPPSGAPGLPGALPSVPSTPSVPGVPSLPSTPSLPSSIPN